MTKITALISFVLLSACHLGTHSSSDKSADRGQEKPSEMKPTEGWSSADDPTLFSDELEFRIDVLPQEGEATNIPWAGSYWPVWQDSINHRWGGDDTLSPAAKYGEAFGIDDIEDKVSKGHGIAKYSSRTECTEYDDCDSTKSESCAKREGEETGVCIPTWWGICHAWAPVSIMELEPEHAVIRNGVEFRAQDIKALATLAYNKTRSKFVSLRCNKSGRDDDGIEYDEYNRPSSDDDECRDTNPGTYHVLLTNYLGIKGESFVEDRTFDYQVWNQPLRSFDVRTMDAVSVAEAHELLDVPPPEVPEAIDTGIETHVVIEDTVEGKGWNVHGPIAVTDATEVLINLVGEGGDADLYVRFGAEPATDKYDCRPFNSGSIEQCSLIVPDGTQELFIAISEFSDEEVEYELTVDLTIPGVTDTLNEGLAYMFNEDAVELRYVEMDVKYISESHSATDGHLADRIDNYTKTDHYRYILEIDGDGKIIGGEWVGASKRNHPDFLWLPTDRVDWPRVADGAIQWDLVKELLDASTSNETIEVDDEAADAGKLEESFEVPKGAWKHFGPFTTAGALTATLSGTGDGDLYVKLGSQPSTSDYDCRPYKGSSTESCAVEGSGDYYVSVYGFTSSEVELVVEWGGAEDGEITEEEASEHLDETGEVAYQEMALYVLHVEEGQSVEVQTTSEGDVDLYLRQDNPPTTNEYDERGYTTSGDETLEYTASSTGTLHIGVHGWAAASFTLQTSDN
jgi:hypothetical protein